MTPENIASILQLRAEGVPIMQIAKRLGLSRGAVEYHLLPEGRRAERIRTRVRANRAVYVTYDCPGCGELLRIQDESRKRQARRGSPGYCRDCLRSLRYRGVLPPAGAPEPDDWMLPEERLDPNVWAERVARLLSPAELRLIGALEPSDLDGSRGAKRARPRRLTEVPRWHDGLTFATSPSVDRPYGKKAQRQEAA